MIKVDVISGFLGAGKTTVIKKLFETGFKDEKVVLIENEFGEIGIDGSFLKNAGFEIKEINAGCICCSLVGDFAASMKEVIEKFNPTRIIVEPSGVGKLSDIINAITTVDADLKLNILATVVDGSKAKLYLKNFGEFFINQVDSADSIIISKTDKIDEEKLEEVVEMIKEKNPSANIITTSISELSSNKLLSILEEKVSLKDELIKKAQEELEHDHHHHHHHDDDDEECCCHHHDEDEDDDECCHHHHDEDDDEDADKCCHHHHEDEEHEHEHHHHEDEEEHEHEHHHHHHHGHDADEIFTSWGMETSRSISKAELEHFLNALAEDESLGIIVRCKGILKASDNESWYYFDFVSGDYEIRLGEPDYTGRICVIGHEMKEDKISELFRKRG